MGMRDCPGIQVSQWIDFLNFHVLTIRGHIAVLCPIPKMHCCSLHNPKVHWCLFPTENLLLCGECGRHVRLLLDSGPHCRKLCLMFNFFDSVNLNRIFDNLLEQALTAILGGAFDFAVHQIIIIMHII